MIYHDYVFVISFLFHYYIKINIFNMMTIPEPIENAINQQEMQKRKKIEKQVMIILNEITDQVEFVLSSGPHHDYFLGKESNKMKLKEMNAKYSHLIQSKLFLEIEKGLTKVNKNKTVYTIEPKHKPTIEEIIEKDKRQIKLKKKYAIEALNEVLRQENEIVKYQRCLKESRSLTKSQLYSYVQDNPQWKSHVKLAIKRQRQLERSLQMKSQQAEKRAIIMKQQSIKAKLQKLEKQKAEHLKLLQERKQKQSILKEQQRQSKAKCQQFVHKTKPKKYRFQQMNEKGEEMLKMLEMQRVQKIRQYKQARQKSNWMQIKEHQSKYFQIISQRKQQWMRKFQSSLSRVYKRPQKSIFAQRIQQQEDQKQLEEKMKENKKKQFLLKIKQYGASVLQNHMPKKFIKSTKQLVKEQNKTVRPSLNRFQQRQKGLAFLNQAKNHHRKLTHTQQKSTIKATSSLPTIKKPVYKDYLKQQPKRVKQGTSFYTVLTEKKGEWASNAKSIIQKMDVSSRKDDKKLLESAFKKIELLKAIL